MSENTTNAYATVSGNPESLTAAPRPYQGEQAMAPLSLKQENIIKQIGIRQLSGHGYVVDVGCQTFAIESSSQLIAKLVEYITNPLATEVKWQEGKLF